MISKEFIEHIHNKFNGKIIKSEEPVKDQVHIWLDKKDIKEVCDYIFNGLKGRFVITSGTDYRKKSEGKFLVSHVFSLDNDKIFIIVHVFVDEDNLEIDSITPVIPAAGWAEREVQDLLGIKMINHTDPRRLVVADDWPEGIYPLRKDFPYDEFPDSMPQYRPKMTEHPEGATIVPIGPFFPVLEEPAYFRLFVEGERIIGCDYRGFYNHKGIEKVGEGALNYNQIIFLAERICGICGTVHGTAYCQAIENLAEIEVPPRAKFIRSIILEFERIHSHLLWLGIAAHIVGFDTILMQAWRIREPIMWLAEKVTGNRKTYGINLIGGVRRDIPKEIHDEIIRIIEKIGKETRAALDAIAGDTPLLMRLEGVGILTNEDAIKYSVLGPTARGSGVAIDARVDHPYAAYEMIPVKKIVETGEDILARTLVRIKETLESVEIIKQCLKEMPKGPIMANMDKPIPPGRIGVSSVEAQRGECHHYVISGEDNTPYRWKARAPTFQNLQAIPVTILDETIADVPISIGSFDPCFSCTERMETVDVKTGEIKIYTKRELEEISRKKYKR